MINYKYLFFLIFSLLFLIFIYFFYFRKKYYEYYENYKKLKIVINSYKDNNTALNKLISSLKKCKNFSNYEFIVFIGGYYDLNGYVLDKEEDNITYIHCNHNSIDFTGLIGIVDYLPKSDEYYFYLHDTTVAGENFLNNLNSINLDNVSSMRLRPSASMNIGIYSNELLHRHKDVFNELKNNDHNKSQEYKKKGIQYEDELFRKDNNNRLINNKDNLVSVSHPQDFYKNGVMRIIEHYDIDLYKIKANWKIKNNYELTL